MESSCETQSYSQRWTHLHSMSRKNFLKMAREVRAVWFMSLWRSKSRSAEKIGRKQTKRFYVKKERFHLLDLPNLGLSDVLVVPSSDTAQVRKFCWYILGDYKWLLIHRKLQITPWQISTDVWLWWRSFKGSSSASTKNVCMLDTRRLTRTLVHVGTININTTTLQSTWFGVFLPWQLQICYRYVPSSVVQKYISLCSTCQLKKPESMKAPL